MGGVGVSTLQADARGDSARRGFGAREPASTIAERMSETEPAGGNEGFTLHWSRVPDEAAAAHVAPGMALLALWPAPVNADVCFHAAGFTDFADADEAWETRAEALAAALLRELAAYGEPRLLGEPLRTRPGLAARVAGARPRELPLHEQLRAPAYHDSLPDAVVAFGPEVWLRTGRGHELYWITLPAAEADAFAARALPRLAGDAPLHRTDLHWAPLLG